VLPTFTSIKFDKAPSSRGAPVSKSLPEKVGLSGPVDGWFSPPAGKAPGAGESGLFIGDSVR
jgi:hypothetical protein